MTTYIALLRKEAKSDYGVDFPDFPGCVTAGRSLEEARLMAEEALRGHVETMLEMGEVLPEPTSLDAVMAEPENRDAIAFLVDLHLPSSKAVRINVTIPEADLRAIDELAKRQGVSRSKLLLKAARRLIDAA
jgi:predicted RNase H-like HicB family nuclease